MAEFLAGYSGLLDAISFVFVVVSLAGFALTASFSKASLTIVVDLAYPVGLLGSLLGWVIMLTNLSDPQAVGPALAISFLTVLYAAVIHGLASGRSRDLSEIDSTLVKKLLGSFIFVGLVLWVMDSGAGIGAFIDLNTVVLFVLSLVFFVIFMFLASCSSTVQIAGSNANFQGPDPAGGKKGLMYDKKSLGNLDIYANAGHKGKGNIEGGYRVNLYVVNNSSKTVTFSPKLVLKTNIGAEIYPVTYSDFVNYAYSLQNAPTPKMPEYRKQDMQIIGTASDQYGNIL